MKTLKGILNPQTSRMNHFIRCFDELSLSVVNLPKHLNCLEGVGLFYLEYSRSSNTEIVTDNDYKSLNTEPTGFQRFDTFV